MTSEQQLNAIAELNGLKSSTVCPYCSGITPYEAGDDYGLTIWEDCSHCTNGKVFRTWTEYVCSEFHQSASPKPPSTCDHAIPHMYACDICDQEESS